MDSALLIYVYMSVWFLIALLIKRNDVADIAWGLGFIVVAVYTFVVYGMQVDRGLLVTALVTIWGSRLAWHIFKRNIHKSEDKRYAAWRASWGKWFVSRSYVQIFMLQGLLLLLIVTPVILINMFRGPLMLTLGDVIGLVVWIIGFYFESVGDRQLRQFLADPSKKGTVLSTGLWRYTRHPNYFGEVTMWWGIWIIALSVPYGIIGVIGPLTITFLILKVSGVPMLEKSMRENPMYDEYRRTTSVFFPLPPKQ